MNKISTSLALSAALDLPIDHHLRALLALRASQLDVPDIDGVASFTVVEPGDSVAEVEAALGFPITGEDAFGFDWVALHPGGWMEACIDLGEMAELLLVPVHADIDTALLAACRAAADQGEGADAE